MLILSLIVVQIVIFVGMIFVLRKIISKNVIKATEHLERLDQDYARKEKELSRQLEEVKRKSQELVAKAKEEADKLKAGIMKEAEKEKTDIISEARSQSGEIMEQADKSRKLLMKEMNERIAKEAVEKACELIQYSLPDEFKKDVHAHWMDELMESEFGELDRLQINENVKEVRVVTPLALNDKQKKNLSQKLKDVIGHPVTLKEELDPKVVAGLVINLGSIVFDGSLKNRIKERARQGT